MIIVIVIFGCSLEFVLSSQFEPHKGSRAKECVWTSVLLTQWPVANFWCIVLSKTPFCLIYRMLTTVCKSSKTIHIDHSQEEWWKIIVLIVLEVEFNLCLLFTEARNRRPRLNFTESAIIFYPSRNKRAVNISFIRHILRFLSSCNSFLRFQKIVKTNTHGLVSKHEHC